MQTFAKGTWIESEESAYNTYSGTPNGSGRRARALCPDGKLRTFRAGIPDTGWTIPAVGKMRGKYVSGFLSVETESGLSTATESDPAFLTFTPAKKYRS